MVPFWSLSKTRNPSMKSSTRGVSLFLLMVKRMGRKVSKVILLSGDHYHILVNLASFIDQGLMHHSSLSISCHHHYIVSNIPSVHMIFINRGIMSPSSSSASLHYHITVSCTHNLCHQRHNVTTIIITSLHYQTTVSCTHNLCRQRHHVTIIITTLSYHSQLDA